jgi:hypothetical protein
MTVEDYVNANQEAFTKDGPYAPAVENGSQRFVRLGSTSRSSFPPSGGRRGSDGHSSLPPLGLSRGR